MIKKDLFSKTITLNWLQMHCKDTMVELDVDPEDPEVLIMTCLVSTDQNSNDDNADSLENPNGVIHEHPHIVPVNTILTVGIYQQIKTILRYLCRERHRFCFPVDITDSVCLTDLLIPTIEDGT